MNVESQIYKKRNISQYFKETIRENQWLLSYVEFPLLTLKNNAGDIIVSNRNVEQMDLLGIDKNGYQIFTDFLSNGYYIFMKICTKYHDQATDILNFIKQALLFRIKFSVKTHPQLPSMTSMLGHFLDELNKTNNKKQYLSQRFVDELRNVTDIDKAVLFYWDKEAGHFQYTASSNDTLSVQFTNVQLPKLDQHNIQSHSYCHVTDWTGYNDPFVQKILPKNKDNLYIINLFNYHLHFGVLFVWCEDGQQNVATYMDELLKVINISGRLVYDILELQKKGEEEQHFRLLYQVTEKFHSSMDTKDVLSEVIDTIYQLYPSFTCHLILNDSESYHHLPIKPLNMSLQETNVTAAQAYITGQLQIKENSSDHCTMIYAPLRGRQGVYGVLEVSIPIVQSLSMNDTKFIRLLANTAGNALENAKLYQQSQKFIADLKIVNQASHQLNSNLRLKDIIIYMKGQIIESFHADEVGFFIFKPTFNILPGSTAFFLHEEQSKGFLKELMNQILNGKDYLFSGDLKNENTILAIPYHSLMAVPMVQNQKIIGMIVALHKDPYAFTFDSFKLLQSIVHHSTLAFLNSMLREELEHLVITDHLTKMYTRKYLDRKILESLRSDEHGLFMLIDIDNFKSINDTFGHQVGDRILIQVAEVIKQNLRECDVAARWGGEELAIYFPCIDLEVGKQIADRLLDMVMQETKPTVTISCGIAIWSRGTATNMTIDILFKNADNALYIAKTSGKNRVAY